MTALSVLALLTTIFCFAVNAYTFRISYPLWSQLSSQEFAKVHAEYLRRLNPVITLPHVLMFFLNGAIAFKSPPWLPRSIALAVFLLTTLVILLSIVVAGPIHERFQRNSLCDLPGLERLVHLSAIRTLLMAAASALLLISLTRALASLPAAPSRTVFGLSSPLRSKHHITNRLVLAYIASSSATIERVTT